MRDSSVVRVDNTKNEREVPLSKNLINSYSVNLIFSGIQPPITFWHAGSHGAMCSHSQNNPNWLSSLEAVPFWPNLSSHWLRK